MIGYKAAYDYKCLNQSYMVGQEYKIDEKPILCHRGFHYCRGMRGIFSYYSMGYRTNVFEIHDLNYKEVATDYHQYAAWPKYATNHIRIVRELSDLEIINELGLYYFTWEDADKNKILTYKTINGFWITKVFDEANSCQYYADSFGKIGKINVLKTNDRKLYVSAIDPPQWDWQHSYDVYDSNKLINLNYDIKDFEHIQYQMFDLYNIKFSKTQKVASH